MGDGWVILDGRWIGGRWVVDAPWTSGGCAVEGHGTDNERVLASQWANDGERGMRKWEHC